MRILLVLAASAALAADLPITGIAHIGFAVSDLEKARSFYTGMLGFEEAFRISRPDASVEMAFFKVNDTQYVELSPGLRPDQDDRLTHIALVTSDIERLRELLGQAGVTVPAQTGRGRDGNRNFSVRDPDGHRVEFVQYMPGSWHTEARGKFVSGRRISNHMLHVGVRIVDLERSLKFYRDILGGQEFWRGGPKDGELRYINLRLPGSNGDYIELMLYPEPPTRSSLGSQHHMCLETSDIQASHRTALDRGAPADRTTPRVGRNGRWQLNLFDPDGSRTELMEPRPAKP